MLATLSTIWVSPEVMDVLRDMMEDEELNKALIKDSSQTKLKKRPRGSRVEPQVHL